MFNNDIVFFHRAGLIEQWGRGTNRVVEMCRKAGIAPPIFQEIGLFAVVTFKVRVSLTAQVTTQVAGVLEAARQPRTRDELQSVAGIKNREHFRKKYLAPLIETGWLERTIPDKPKSRLQKYRITVAGENALRKEPP